MKIITDPKQSKFRGLQAFGTVLSAVGLIIIVVTLFSFVIKIIPADGVRSNPTATAGLIATYSIYVLSAIPMLIVGQVLHWLVAMWKSGEERNLLLRKLTGQIEHN